jgi:hypothetical protein
MNRRTATRIATLEATAVAQQQKGCPTCRAWPGLVMIDDDGNRSRPESCPDCGRHVPDAYQIHIVGVPLDVL